MPTEPTSGLDLLDQLHRLGFVNGGLLPEALGAKWLADAWTRTWRCS